MPKKQRKSAKKKQDRIAVKKPKSSEEEIKKTRIRVVGIGGGGGTIVSEIAPRIEKASFFVANTDVQALRTTGRKINRFHFGQDLTHGLGTGMNAELGREAAQNEKDKIKKILEGQDLCILVACLGGGAGSGAVPVFAKISKDLGNLTYGIFTLPFKFEGEKKMEIARESLRRVKNHLNAVTIIPNERVFQIIDKSIPLKQALSVVNKNLADSLSSLLETIYEPGLINIDFADFKTILEGRGRLTYLNTVEVEKKEGSIKDLIEKVLSSPLYPYTIRGAKGVLFNIAGEKNLSLSEVNQVSKTISELTYSEAKIIFGVSQKQKYSDVIKTTLLATGCGMKIFPSPAKKKSVRKRKRKKSKIIKNIPEKKTKRKNKPKAKKRTKPRKTKKKSPKKKRNKFPLKKSKVKTSKKSGIIFPSEGEKEEKQAESLVNSQEKIRKNGLQIRKEAEEAEKEMVEKEKFWETPAFLRKKFTRDK